MKKRGIALLLCVLLAFSLLQVGTFAYDGGNWTNADVPGAALAITVTADRTTATTVDTITWTAKASGGKTAYSYCFYVYKDGVKVRSSGYTPTKTYSYRPTEAGSYTVKAFVKDAAGTSKSVSGGSVKVTAAKPLEVVSIKADKTTATTADTITWTAKGSGGKTPYNYCFFVYKDGTQVKKTGYSTTKTFSYKPTAAGSYTVKVFIKDAVGNVKSKTSAATKVTAGSAALSISSIKADKTSGNTGEKITWTVKATGGKTPYTYCFYIYKDGAQVKKTSYGSSNKFSYTPTAGGSYTVKAFVKDASGTSKSKLSTATKVTATDPLTLKSIKANSTSASAGTTVTWTATASGGTTPYNYCFVLYKDGTQVKKTSYGTSNKFSYKLTEGGSYTVKAFVKDANGTVKSKTSSATTVTSVRYRALLVGEEAFNPICTRNRGDVELMANVLASVKGPAGGKYSVTEKYNLSNSALKSAIATTFAGATDNDVSLFFIATHGDASSTGSYAGALALVDSSGNQTWILMSELASCLKAIPGKVIVILESCGSGAAIYNGTDGDAAAANDAFVNEVIRVFAENDSNIEVYDANTGEFRVSNKFYVLTASAYLQLSWGSESRRCNYFTKWLTEGIGTSGSMPADTNYGNGDGKLTLEEAYSYVSAVGDNYTFYDGYSYYTQQVKRYPEYSSFQLFTR